MDIILTLTIRYLKQNKKRTISMLLGIVAASFLLALSGIFIYSSIERLSDFQSEQEDIAKLVMAVSAMFGIILASLTLFIYQMLELSAAEKVRQLGILGSVGATPFQRGKLTFYEALILSVIGLPSGLLLGVCTAYVVFPFPVVISVKWLILLIGFEAFVMIVIGLLHAFLSTRGNVIQLLLNHTERRNLKKVRKFPDRIAKKYGAGTYFALKNLYFFRKRYLIICISFILSMILFLDGFIYLNYMDGNYSMKDERVTQYADLTLVEMSGGNTENWESFTQEVAAFPEVKEATFRKETNLGGVVFSRENIADDPDSFTAYEIGFGYNNPTKNGYEMQIRLIGLDDKSFEEYMKKAGLSGKLPAKDNKSIPVIVEDFVLVDTEKTSGYRSILNIKDGSEFTVLTDSGPCNFNALTTTTVTPDRKDIESVTVFELNELYFYTTIDYVRKFADQYGVEDSLSINIKDDVELPEQILYPAVIQVESSGWTQEFKIYPKFLNKRKEQTLKNLLKEKDKKMQSAETKIREIGESYGLIDTYTAYKNAGEDFDTMGEFDYFINSYPSRIMACYADRLSLLRHTILYGILMFLVVISVFQIIKIVASSVTMRKREFAVLLSMGMTKDDLRKMVSLEGIFCLFISFIVGSTFSIALGHYMFDTWEQSQLLDACFPYQLFIWVLLVLIVLIFITVFIAVGSVKKIQIADMLKTDTLS